MDEHQVKARLHRDLASGRAAVLAKVDGLSEYDARRPLTATGTNLLGLVKHLATWESRYLGAVFGRPFPEPLPAWDDHTARGTDVWVTEHESRADVLALFGRVALHSDATVAALPLDAPGRVGWWSPPEVTLFAVLLHLIGETSRHAGHADVLREGLDGAIGTGPGRTARVEDDASFWTDHWDQVDRAARLAADQEPREPADG